MITLNFCVLFTVIGCILSVQPMPKNIAVFGAIPCNFSWADDIKKIYPMCDINAPHYVPPNYYLCAGLLQKSQDLCLLLRKLNHTDVLNKKPNIDHYDSKICIRFKDFVINSPDTDWISVYNNFFSSNVSCLDMCVDLRQKVNPLCVYNMWVTDEFIKLRNKTVNEGAHIVPFNSKIKTNSMHLNKAKVDLSDKVPIIQNSNQTSINKTEKYKLGKNISNEDTTRSIILNKNPSITKSISQKNDNKSTSEPSIISVSSIAQTSNKISKSTLPIKFEVIAKQDQTVDIQTLHSSSVINEISVTDKETIYASTTVQTTTKEYNPSDSVLEKSQIIPLKISTSKTVVSDDIDDDEATGNEINIGEITDQDDLDEVKEPSADGALSAVNGIETQGPAHEESEIVTTADQFMKQDDSHFFAYFMTMMVLCIIGYLVFHNKQKILALALEGRSRRSRRRPNTSGYRKLDSNLEEAITSSRSSSATNVIY